MINTLFVSFKQYFSFGYLAQKLVSKLIIFRIYYSNISTGISSEKLTAECGLQKVGSNFFTASMFA